MCVCSLSYPARKAHAPHYPTQSSAACPALHYISPCYLINGMVFGKKLLNIKCVFFSSTTSVWNISHSKNTSVTFYHTCAQVFMRSTIYSFQILMKLEFSYTLLKNTQISNVMKICPVRSSSTQMDTDTHDEAKCHFSQFF